MPFQTNCLFIIDYDMEMDMLAVSLEFSPGLDQHFPLSFSVLFKLENSCNFVEVKI